MTGDPNGFLREFAAGRAEQVLPIPGGFAVRSTVYPRAHDHNSAWLWQPCDPAEALAAVEKTFADLGHRRIEVDGAARTQQLADVLHRAGYEREDDVIMTSLRPPAADRPGPDGVTELDLDQRVAAARAAWSQEQPEWDDGVTRQLGDRIRTAPRAARCTFLAVRGDDGTVEATADLFVRGDLAQIEEVITNKPFQNRGHASRLVRAAVERSTAPEVFLVAEADDWPRRLYDRLGFDVTGERSAWSRLIDP